MLMQQSETTWEVRRGFVEHKRKKIEMQKDLLHTKASSLLSDRNLRGQIRLRWPRNVTNLITASAPLPYTDLPPRIVESIWLSLKHGPCLDRVLFDAGIWNSVVFHWRNHIWNVHKRGIKQDRDMGVNVYACLLTLFWLFYSQASSMDLWNCWSGGWSVLDALP